jgi:hypothetical protein
MGWKRLSMSHAIFFKFKLSSVYNLFPLKQLLVLPKYFKKFLLRNSEEIDLISTNMNGIIRYEFR